MTSPAPSQPKISVVILNHNGLVWLQRCFDSLRAQTIFSEIEVIFADNASADGSDRFAEETLRAWPNGVFVQNGSNLGFSEGNNRAAVVATGKFLLFINNDMWLEPDCLRILLTETETADADAGSPRLDNYEDSTFQSIGGTGMDLFGLGDSASCPAQTQPLFGVPGGSYLIKRDLFQKIGGFDAAYFMYGEECDLSWRVWISGGQVVGVPAARAHHRTPPQAQEWRTSETKRFLANRNDTLTFLKNAQHLLLLLVLSRLVWLAAEALVSLILVRRWSFVRRAYLEALVDVWRMRSHVTQWRRRIRTFRRRSDFWMLRFIRLKPARLGEIQRILKHGAPQVEQR